MPYGTWVTKSIGPEYAHAEDRKEQERLPVWAITSAFAISLAAGSFLLWNAQRSPDEDNRRQQILEQKFGQQIIELKRNGYKEVREPDSGLSMSNACAEQGKALSITALGHSITLAKCVDARELIRK